MNLQEVITRLIVTEKSSEDQANKKYTFAINRNATKIDVKNAIKEIYGAEVATVRTSLVPKKERLVGKGRLWTKRPVVKKATVTLKGGKTIDPNKIGKAKEDKSTKTSKN